jgi:hypothetical protein
MTTQELIVGHFEGTLTPGDETQLQQLLSSSTEARTLYDRHAGLNAMLTADAAATEPSKSLGRRALAASLLAIPESIVGSAATAWFTIKVIGGLSAAVFGGLAVISIVTSNASHDAEQATSASHRAVKTVLEPVPFPPPVLPQMVETSKTTLGEEARSKQASEPSSPQRSAAASRQNAEPAATSSRTNPLDINREPSVKSGGGSPEMSRKK